MRARLGFVSNSSSSSFIVLGKVPTECECVLLNKAQAHAVINYIETREYDSCKVACTDLDNVFLTKFISDGGDFYYEIDKKYDAYAYTYGNHSGPYSEEDYDILREDEYHYNDVWILKEHNLEEE